MKRHAREQGRAPHGPARHVHHESGPGTLLARLGFIVGDFEGTGHMASGNGTFTKVLHGRHEAGGRFFSLRMGADYPLPDGRVDHHDALVIVGESADRGSIVARAYTDGGDQHDYVVHIGADQFVFADIVPDHGRHWRRARKILVPTLSGFDERLEVALADGNFEPFYTIAMQRLNTTAGEHRP